MIKPKITLRPQFKLPPGVMVWCHICNEGFKTLEEGRKHTLRAEKKHGVVLGKELK